MRYHWKKICSLKPITKKKEGASMNQAFNSTKLESEQITKKNKGSEIIKIMSLFIVPHAGDAEQNKTQVPHAGPVHTIGLLGE